MREFENLFDSDHPDSCTSFVAVEFDFGKSISYEQVHDCRESQSKRTGGSSKS